MFSIFCIVDMNAAVMSSSYITEKSYQGIQYNWYR